MLCDCADFPPIELDRASINGRIKESPAIRKRLIQLAENKELRLYLFRCPDCGQLWQSGHEWNFADKEYLFQVPSVEIADWLVEPFRQPAAMTIFSASMRNFFERCKFEVSDAQCRAENCTERAIRNSVLCRRHHIESLQKQRLLPQSPVGKLFPPYFIEASDSA